MKNAQRGVLSVAAFVVSSNCGVCNKARWSIERIKAKGFGDLKSCACFCGVTWPHPQHMHTRERNFSIRDQPWKPLHGKSVVLGHKSDTQIQQRSVFNVLLFLTFVSPQ